MKRTTSYVLAGVIALALMGCGATVDPTKGGDTADKAEIEATACIDADAAADAGMKTSEALQAGFRASKVGDIEGMARSLHEAAEWMTVSAAASEADPAISVPAGLAADLFEKAAEHLDGATTVADINASTDDILEATEYVDEATAAVEATKLGPC